MERPVLDPDCNCSVKRFKLNSSIVCHSEASILCRVVPAWGNSECAESFTPGGRSGLLGGRDPRLHEELNRYLWRLGVQCTLPRCSLFPGPVTLWKQDVSLLRAGGGLQAVG